MGYWRSTWIFNNLHGIFLLLCFLFVGVWFNEEIGKQHDKGDRIQKHGDVKALWKVTVSMEHVNTSVDNNGNKLSLKETNRQRDIENSTVNTLYLFSLLLYVHKQTYSAVFYLRNICTRVLTR